jgi:DNA-directed RNA polymerase subunit RPC12/RpoP
MNYINTIRSSRKFLVKIVIALELLIAALLTIGCGTVDMNVHTRVKPSGDIIQELSIATTGMMTALIDSEFAADLESQGWEVERTTSGETTTVVATRKYSKNEPVTVPGLLEQDQSDYFKLHVKNYVVIKDYYLELTLPEDTSFESELPDEELDGEDEIFSEEMMESMFKFSWTVTLPGKIMETNADEVSGSSATWNLPYSSMGSGQYMMLRSRYINWMVIGIIAGCVILAVLLVFLLKKPKKSTAYYGPQQQPQYQYRVAQSTTNCFNCGYPNTTDRKFCVNCGHSLVTTGARQSTSFQDQFNCPYCGYLNPGHSRFCSRCGQSLFDTGRSQPMEQQLYYCPVCRAPVYYGTNPCPYCNSKMNWK